MQFYYIYVIIFLEKKLGDIFMKYYIDFIIKNNDEEVSKYDIKAIYNENKGIEFNYDKESIKITINKDNIIMKKENDESIITFNFNLNKKTETKYYLKDLGFYIDTEILTNKLIIEKEKIYIEYKLWLQGEEAGEFKYQIDIKEA